MDIIEEDFSVNDQHACELINRIRSSDWKLPSDYCFLKSLLEDYSNPLSSKVLNATLGVLSDSSIYTFHDEETTVLLELHLRTLLAAVNAISRSKTCLPYTLCESLFAQLIEFAKLHISDSDIGEALQPKNAEATTTISDKILMRNYNIDFLLGVLRDTIHALSDNNNRTSNFVTTVDFRDTDTISQLREVFSFKYPISSWYSRWKKLTTASHKLIIRLKLHQINLETQEADERILIEHLWLFTSNELKQQQPQGTLDNKTQNVNVLLRNDSIARSLWFGVLDLAQELATSTNSLTNLVFIYYLVLQSLQHAPNIYIRSKAIEVLTIISRKHQMLNDQFNFDFQNILKVFKETSPNDIVNLSYHLTTLSCGPYPSQITIQ